MTQLEKYFQEYRENIIGINQKFETPFGEQKIVYADWTASGRAYRPIEDYILEKIAPFIGNPHTESTVTGASMTHAYHEALQLIKKHVGGNENDVILSCGQGMTAAISKLQRILGLKVHEKFLNSIKLEESERPIVFVSHMEHHSNQTSWEETLADVEIIYPDTDGGFGYNNLNLLLEKYKNRQFKIASITACSNVTGVKTPYHKVAEIMHKNNGWCFVDFAASAPYVSINMHPENAMQQLDAIFFSPHKLLGGPGSTGILVFNKALYNNSIPDQPGGGTVEWTNPWGEHKYSDNIEAREDGGTPRFLQTIRAALAIKLKEKMGVKNILDREQELCDIVWDKLPKVKGIHILDETIKDRLGVFAFYLEGVHYNLAVKILNDRYGIQVRGGCSCAGTYGHYLFGFDKEKSNEITCHIDNGDLSVKPGWVRLSVHPTMTNEELSYILNAIEELSLNYKEWEKDYVYNNKSNEFNHKKALLDNVNRAHDWFENALELDLQIHKQ